MGAAGAGVGLTGGRIARTAATFCVFLTLETVDLLAVAFLLAVFAAGFLLFETGFAGEDFFAGLALAASLRAGFLEAAAFETVALFAFGFEAGFAFTARFAVFEDVLLAVVRAVDRRKPFERLLLIWV